MKTDNCAGEGDDVLNCTIQNKNDMYIFNAVFWFNKTYLTGNAGLSHPSRKAKAPTKSQQPQRLKQIY